MSWSSCTCGELLGFLNPDFVFNSTWSRYSFQFGSKRRLRTLCERTVSKFETGHRFGKRLLEFVYTIESRASLFDSVLHWKHRQGRKQRCGLLWIGLDLWGDFLHVWTKVPLRWQICYWDAVPARLLLAGCRVYWSCSKRRVATCRFRVPEPIYLSQAT